MITHIALANGVGGIGDVYENATVGVGCVGCQVAGSRGPLEVREDVLKPAQHAREHHLPFSGATVLGGDEVA
jgi:hypothetical protein